MASQRGFGVINRRSFATVEAPVVMPSTGLYEHFQSELELEQEARTTFLDWSLRIPEPKTGTLNFKKWPFQKELYVQGTEDHEVCVQKSTQVGVSTYLIRWAMYWPDMKGLTSVYVFPKKVQLRDFTQGRVRPLVRTGEYLPTRVPADHIDNAMMKQIGMGLVYFRGSEVKDDLDSVDADAICFDEYDRLVQANIEDAEHRVDASPLGMIRRVGNPTIDDFGIARAYANSDQRVWKVKCESCNEWQELDFWENVDMTAAIIVCRKCTKPLDVRKGQWVAKFPDRDVKGYHISRLMHYGVNLRKIIANSEKREAYAKQTFYNKDLGLPYSPKEGRLSLEQLKAAQSSGGMYTMVPGYAGDNLVTMGVDVASKRNLNVRISEHLAPEGKKTKKRALWIGEVERFTDDEPGEGPSVETLMRRYSVNMCCIDHEPEYRSARAVAALFPGRVYLVMYSTQEDVIKVDTEMLVSKVRRVESIDAMMEMIRSQRNLLPADWPEGYTSQMRAPVRVVEKDLDNGRVTVRYQSTGPDDYAHAEVYDLVATEVWWILQTVEAESADDYSYLDDHVDMTRSDVNDPEAMGYRPGPDVEVRPDEWAGGE